MPDETPAPEAEHPTEPTETRQDPEGLGRVLFFGDAVVAIAITLLALPLVDAAIEAQDAADFLATQSFELIAAGISFWAISASWRANHRLFRLAHGWTNRVVSIQFLWLASIVALPIATALIVGANSTDRLALGIYLGLVAITPTLTQAQHLVLERGGMLDGPPTTRLQLVDNWLRIVLRVVALLLTQLLPQIGLWSLAVLVIGTVFHRFVEAREHRGAIDDRG